MTTRTPPKPRESKHNSGLVEIKKHVSSSVYLGHLQSLCSQQRCCNPMWYMSRVCGCVSSRKQEYIDLADVRWMREKWRELMTRTHGDYDAPPFQCALV